MFFCFLLFFSLNTFYVFSEITKITGCFPDHAGSGLVFNEYKEGLSLTKAKVFEVIPDSTGCFSIEISLNETKFLFTEEGSFIYYFYAEPGRSYILNFPQIPKRSSGQIKNPFSLPAEIHLCPGLDDESVNVDKPELNSVIKTYDELFNPFYNEQLLRYLSPEQSRIKLDSFLIISHDIEESYNNEYFKKYIFYKKGLLEFTVSQFNMREIQDRYFISRPVLTNIPSYRELFNVVFDKYFSYLTVNPFYKNLYNIMFEGNYSVLDTLLMSDPVLKNDTIRGLVLLNELHNEFNSGNIPTKSILSLLDSVKIKSTSPECRNLAESIKNKNMRFMPGSVIPELWMTDQNGNIFDIADIKGKLIYLGFCDLSLRECQKEFEYLKLYQNAFADKLLIITAIGNISWEELDGKAKEMNYNWTLTVLNDPEKALNDYNIKGMPIFYLITPDSKFLKSPAGMPSTGFEKVIYQIIRENNKKEIL